MFLLLSSAFAGPRTSANYSIATDTTDGGGKRATSAAYTNDGSAGGIAGLSTVAAPAETAKHGYIGQLTEVTALQLAATPATVNETATRQLSADQVLDDLTTNAVPAASITWSVQSGPITGISASGLATAGVVYQDTAATAQGVYAGNTGTLNLTVLDILPDNFGTYAGDGLPDSWQNQYFGLNNPNAAPGYMSDGSGLTNLFKYTAGLAPNDATSTFSLINAIVPGQPTQKNVIFNPIVAGRSYTVQFSLDLSAASWQPLTNATQGDSGSVRTVTDLSAGARKFYRVQVTKP